MKVLFWKIVVVTSVFGDEVPSTETPSIVLATMLFQPVPPLATCSIPTMSLVRLTAAEETTPKTDLRMPETEPKVKPLETVRLEVEAVPVTARFVEVALARELFPVTVRPEALVEPRLVAPETVS